PEYVQAFRLTSDEALSAFRDVGFGDLQLHLVPAGRTYASLDVAIDSLRKSPSLAELLGGVPDAERPGAWEAIVEGFKAFATPSGVSIPGEQRVIVGSA